MNRHEYEFDEIVIGNTLGALIYCYFNSVPLVYNSENKPMFFDFFDLDTSLEKLHIESQQYELEGLESNRIVGHSKLQAWERLMFILSLSGLVSISDKVATIRVENNLLKITTKKFRMIKMKFNKLRIFDTENVEGLDIPEKQVTKFKVIDWVDVKSGMVHPYDFFETDNDFVKEIYFYPSTRFDGPGQRKDLVAISYLNKFQLENFENSDTYVKFRILRLMKKAGIRGARNGRDFNNPEKYKYYAVKVEPRKREVLKLNPDFYHDTENIIFDYRSAEEMYIDSTKKNNYTLKLNELIARK
tara:strand:+ start:299 stop:1201 length:903 start_codon:yes stop_codon:yes gene_type:complete